MKENGLDEVPGGCFSYGLRDMIFVRVFECPYSLCKSIKVFTITAKTTTKRKNLKNVMKKKTE